MKTLRGRELSIGSVFFDPRSRAYQKITGFERRPTAAGNQVAICGNWQVAIEPDREYEVRS